MIWIFLTAVLLLTVLHRGFRRFMIWGSAACAGLATIVGIGLWIHWRSSGTIADIATLPALGLPGSAVPASDMPDAPIDTSKVQWDEVPAPPPGYKLQCPAGQQVATDTLTTKQSCYNPHDAAQLAEHLKSCSHEGDPPWMAKDIVISDRRSIPCNAFDKFDNDCPVPPTPPWPGCVLRAAEPWSAYGKK